MRIALNMTAIFAFSLLGGCGDSAPVSNDGMTVDTAQPELPDTACTDFRAGHRNAYFGDLHTHTNLSIDAFFFNSLNGPREALRFAQGEPAWLPAGDEDPNTAVRSVQLDRPLDFAAVTDHAESLGNFFTLCTVSGTIPADANPACNLLGAQIRANVRSFVSGDTNPFLALLQGVTAELPTTRSAWRETQRINNEEYKPCTFSTLHAYEYTPNALGQALHRNVFFRNDAVPDDAFSAVGATSSLEQDNANIEWALFDHLQSACVDQADCEVFTIAHSSNTSNGRFFRPIDPATGLPPARDDQPLTLSDARLRASLERGFEISQHKGQSECAVGVTNTLFGGEEDRCDFENAKTVCTGEDDPPACAEYCTGAETDPAFCQHRDPLFVVDVCDSITSSGSLPDNCTAPGDYVRGALTQGLLLKDRLDGLNPYRLVLSASTDNHNGTPGNVQEEGFTGHTGVLDDEPAEQLGEWQCLDAGAFDNADPNDPANCPGRLFADVARPFNPGGIVGAWAPQNTRDAIWNAVRNGETWGTSGPRLRMRMLASAQAFPDDVFQRLADGEDPATSSALPGVPMGADLELASGETPHIAAWAMQDPDGNPLQALQIIKGWVDVSGERHIRIFTIAETTAPVQLPARATCDVAASNHPSQLAATWQDPGFDADQHAFYYLRVLEVPSCRYNTHLCLTKEVECGLLNPDNGVFPSATGLQGFEGCCSIQEENTTNGTRFFGTPVFQTIEERGWSSPIWYSAAR